MCVCVCVCVIIVSHAGCSTEKLSLVMTGANHVPTDALNESILASAPHAGVPQRPALLDTTPRQVPVAY